MHQRRQGEVHEAGHDAVDHLGRRGDGSLQTEGVTATDAREERIFLTPDHTLGAPGRATDDPGAAAVAAMRSILVVADPGSDGGLGDLGDLAVAMPYEDALAAASTEPIVTEGRSGDDTYLMYTGGTTGRPKGVVWHQEDAFFACIGGGDPMRLQGPCRLRPT